jgi:hypothetical protein
LLIERKMAHLYKSWVILINFRPLKVWESAGQDLEPKIFLVP